jgi:hypothetical protein
MKMTLLSFGLVGFLCCGLQAEDQKSTPRSRFLNLNPNYAKGAGDFYRRQYLPSAAPAMTSAIDDPIFVEADAQRILNTLIDDFLEKYVDGGGTITRLERFRLIQAMDQSVKGIVKNDAAIARYRKWREDTNRQANALTFLMTVEDLSIALPKKLIDSGWTVKSPKVTELEKYKGYFNETPDNVMLFENAALSKGDKKAWVMVVSYPTTRLQDQVRDRSGPFRADDKKLPPVDFFWQTHDMVFFAATGEITGPQAEMVSFVRSHMVGQPRFQGKSVPID